MAEQEMRPIFRVEMAYRQRYYFWAVWDNGTLPVGSLTHQMFVKGLDMSKVVEVTEYPPCAGDDFEARVAKLEIEDHTPTPF